MRILKGMAAKMLHRSMRRQARRTRVNLRLILVCASLCAAMACLPARAQTAAPPLEPESAFGDFMRNFKFRHPPVTPKDFVVKSRAAAPPNEFMPVEKTPPDHDIKVKSKEEVAATTAALDALRGSHDHVAGRKPGASAAKGKKRLKAAAAAH
jgi:hypothetical protein